MSRVKLYSIAASSIQYLFVFFITFQTTHLFLVNYRNIEGWNLPNGRLVGADFFAFYSAGKNIDQISSNSFYDFNSQIEIQKNLLQEHNQSEGLLPFIYPPLAAKFFSFFYNDNYVESFSRWIAFNLFLLGIAFTIAIKLLTLSPSFILRYAIYLLAFTPLTLECLAGGQTSIIGLLIVCACVSLLSQRREFLAGLVLSFSYYKPPLFLVLVILQLFRYRFKFASGFALGASILIITTISLTGWEAFYHYIIQATSYRYGSNIVGQNSLPTIKAVGLLGFIVDLFPTAHKISYSLFFISWLALLWWWTSHRRTINLSKTQIFAADLSLSLLLSIQMVVYDLSILTLALLTAWHTIQNNNFDKQKILVWVSTAGLYLDFIIRNIALDGINLKLTPLFIALLFYSLTISPAKNAQTDSPL